MISVCCAENIPLARLSVVDLIVFVAYMLLLVGVGLISMRQQKSLKGYFLADQNVNWLIVAISVLAALFSGISFLGAPAESFFFDLTVLWTVLAFFIATPITTLLFLPFFRSLNIYTAYEYLERRFDNRLRWIASGLFITRVACYLGLVIAAPSLAIVEITGWDFSTCVLLTGLAATLYTALGGMKAVIWTDSIQFLVLCGGIILILGYAIAEVPGGLAGAWTPGRGRRQDHARPPRLEPEGSLHRLGSSAGRKLHKPGADGYRSNCRPARPHGQISPRMPASAMVQARADLAARGTFLSHRHGAVRLLPRVSRPRSDA